MTHQTPKLTKQQHKDILTMRRITRTQKNGKLMYTTYRTIAKHFGVSHECIRDICARAKLSGRFVK
jgi:DNA-directed RNA polymerase sigma subunit (sigma70/sigma32)